MTAAKQTTDGQAYTTGYVYNLSGGLIEETYPSGRVVKNVLDNKGDLAIVQSKKNQAAGFFNYADSFSYNASGAVTSMQLGNGRWESTQFNSRLQPVQIALGVTQGTSNLLKLDYSYGTTANNGNVQLQTITVPTVGANTGFVAVQNYNYDSLNRLKDATENVTPNGGSASQSWKQTFTFDRYGNRRFDAANTITIPPGCQEAVCNPQIDVNTNKLVGYQFDASGNTKQDAENRKFTYDAENKQVKVETIDASGNPVSTIGEYFYNGDGKRVKKYVPATGETTLFVYNASGKLVAEYSTIVTPPQDAKVSYLTNDTLGSPRITTDQNGSVISRRDFMPYGEEIFSPQRTQAFGYTADTVRQKFTGYERDNESDLDFAQARMYVNKLGRFTSPDEFIGGPIEQFESVKKKSEKQALAYAEILLPQSLNKYQYCYNNPLKFTDPTGHEVELTNTNAKDRNEAKGRLLFNLTAAEKKYFKVEYDKNKKEYFLKLTGNVDAALSKNHTKAFGYLVESVKDSKTIGVEINDKFTVNGKTFDTTKDYGGGATVPQKIGDRDVQVYLSRNGNPDGLKDSSGNKISDPVSIIAAHEVLGHGRLYIQGKSWGQPEAIAVENDARAGSGLALRAP